MAIASFIVAGKAVSFVSGSRRHKRPTNMLMVEKMKKGILSCPLFLPY